MKDRLIEFCNKKCLVEVTLDDGFVLTEVIITDVDSGNNTVIIDDVAFDIDGIKYVYPSFIKDAYSDIMVDQPPHYQSETGLEVIDVIEAFTFDLMGIEATDTGNIIKYICRWKKKNGLQDLKKAKWYLKHLIEHVEKLEKENA